MKDKELETEEEKLIIDKTTEGIAVLMDSFELRSYMDALVRILLSQIDNFDISISMSYKKTWLQNVRNSINSLQFWCNVMQKKFELHENGK